MASSLQADLSKLQKSSIMLSCQLKDHQGKEIKYFCCSEDCMQPLCPECIQNHSEYHERKNKVAILKNFGEVRAQNHQKILKHINSVQSDLENLDSFLKINVMEKTNVVESIHEFRDTLISMITEYFLQLERDLTLQITEDYNIKAEKVDRVTREITIYLDQLKEYEASLETEACAKVIARVHRRDLTKEYEHMKSRLAKNETVLDTYEVTIDQRAVKKISEELSRCLKLTRNNQSIRGHRQPAFLIIIFINYIRFRKTRFITIGGTL